MKHKITAQEFYQLLISSDQTGINKISGAYIKRLAGYLRTVHGADHEIAADCSHQAFEKVFAKIRKNELSDVDNIYSYLIRSVKNEYLMFLRTKKHEMPGDPDYLHRIEGDTASDVARVLHTEDKEKALRFCVERLGEGRQSFYHTMLRYIHEADAITAKKLNISYASFRTRKFRLIEALRDCIKRKGF